MDSHTQPAETARIIDLTSQTDVLFWCRVLDLSMDQLREAVHHAGHQVEEVERWVRQKRAAG